MCELFVRSLLFRRIECECVINFTQIYINDMSSSSSVSVSVSKLLLFGVVVRYSCSLAASFVLSAELCKMMCAFCAVYSTLFKSEMCKMCHIKQFTFKDNFHSCDMRRYYYMCFLLLLLLTSFLLLPLISFCMQQRGKEERARASDELGSEAKRSKSNAKLTIIAIQLNKSW